MCDEPISPDGFVPLNQAKRPADFNIDSLRGPKAKVEARVI